MWFCEDFEAEPNARWDWLPPGAGASIGTANGTAVVEKEGRNTVLHYEAGSSKGVVAAIKDTAFAAVAAKHTADYYVEAKIRPLSNSSNNKFVCLLGRYQDVNNWYGGCLNVQNGSNSKVEFHKANAGKWFRARQFNPRTIVNDKWYTLRMEMKGDNLTFYIDDDFVGSFVDASIKAPGKIGLWLDNRSFVIDDIQVGDANIKPVLLSITPDTAWTSEVGGADREVEVSASKSDGSPDGYTLSVSDPRVLSVVQRGNKVLLHAVGAGNATLSFTSQANPALRKQIAASIEPAFVLPTARYAPFSSEPAAGSRGAYIDQRLSLRFDGPFSLSGKGSVRIFDAQDDRLVDVIKPRSESNAIGPSADQFYRGLSMPLLQVDGNTLHVRPHANTLQYGKTYYVAIAEGTVLGARLAGQDFVGLGKTAGWRFETRAAPAKGLTTLRVDDDGEQADFRSLQGALNYAMQNLAKETPVRIKLMNGRYEEPLYLRGKDNVSIEGESRDQTVIAFENYESLNGGSGAGSPGAASRAGGGRALFLVEQSDLLSLSNMSLHNTHIKRNGINNQAETLYFNGSTQRLIARDMNFISRQDTLQLNAYSWFYNSLIAGDVDFIWGSAKAALFENSEIRTVVDSADATRGSYIVQARVLSPTDKGYVFLRSRLTREAGVPDGLTTLARSAGVPAYFDNVLYLDCQLDAHIAPAGWWVDPIPNPDKASATLGWREFGSTASTGLKLDARVGAARRLSAAEAAPYLSREQVFAAIGWVP
ncbi:hypothetical protein GCM10028811_23470 [Uliginosibacterium sediminicola]